MSDTDAASIGDVKKGFQAAAGDSVTRMKRDGSNAEMTEAQAAAFRAQLGLSAGGAAGANGWSPVLATVADGERRVQLVQDWIGGTGAKPPAGKYIGATGLVATAAEAVDMRGGGGRDGKDGKDGAPGGPGGEGPSGANGWTPVEANVIDGERRVKRIVDWVGGTGPKPATGKYVGAAGLVDTAAEATDLRGAGGSGSGDMKAANNGSDFDDPAVVRDNLQVYSKTETDAATKRATVAQVRAGKASGVLIEPDEAAGAMGFTALTDAATVAVDLDTGPNFTLLTTAGVGAGRTLGLPTKGNPGQYYTFRVTAHAGATLAYHTAIKWPGGTVQAIANTAGAITEIAVKMISAARFDVVGFAKDIR